VARPGPGLDPALARLAAAHGVDTWYENWRGERVEVEPDVVAAVLDLLDAGTTEPHRPPRAMPPPLPPVPRSWGWMLQLYALRGARSWGVGDFADLAGFTRWAAGTGAGAVLLNPLHAVPPVEPVPASPYSPSSRRFVNPLYLRVEDTDAYRRANADTRARVDALRPAAGGDLIDYDAAWRAKLAALELLWADEPRFEPAGAVRDFATYNALAEAHGADWRAWPADLRRPDASGVAAAGTALRDRIGFHAWLQRLCDEQLAAVGEAARDMPIGIVHDLAVGIDPAGADGWMLQDVLATGARIGAPPDEFNQQGQDWGLAAWRPDRLAATGYAAYRDLLRGALRHAGGLRVDHVAGLWRLWWVPPGARPDQGTYVHYDPAAMLGILAEEARAAGAIVVGEDLGTVQPAVREALRDQGVLGSAVLWFTRDESGGFTPPARWPAGALGTISTHDLPTAAGFLSGEHVRARAAAGVLGRPEADEREAAARERERLLDLLRAERLDSDEPILALHRLLARTPCRLVLASPYDVLGEVRQPNLPGTTSEYPNWRIPLPVPAEALESDERMLRIAEILRDR
jgi:4-alpha-glucanotransferase